MFQMPTQLMVNLEISTDAPAKVHEIGQEIKKAQTN